MAGKAGYKRERRPGVWELVVYVGRDPVTNKHRWRTKTWKGTSRGSAGALAAWVVECKADRPGTAQTVSWLLAEYQRLLAQEGRSPTTLRTYHTYTEKWIKPHIGPVSLEDLTAGHLRKLEAAMTSAGKSAATIRQVHAIVQGALRFAEEHEWVDKNVALVVRRPKQQRTTVVAPTVEEVEALYRAAKPVGSDLATAIALGALVGRRLGELCALRWSDIDLEVGTMRIASSTYTVKGVVEMKDTKTHAAHTVPLNTLAVARLEDRKAYQLARAERIGTTLINDPFILSRDSEGGGPPRPDGYTQSFGDLRDKLGMTHLHFHSLRHFAGTFLLDSGVDIITAAKLLGHADGTMLAKTYAHGTAKAERAGADALGKRLALAAPAT